MVWAIVGNETCVVDDIHHGALKTKHMEFIVLFLGKRFAFQRNPDLYFHNIEQECHKRCKNNVLYLPVVRYFKGPPVTRFTELVPLYGELYYSAPELENAAHTTVRCYNNHLGLKCFILCVQGILSCIMFCFIYCMPGSCIEERKLSQQSLFLLFCL